MQNNNLPDKTENKQAKFPIWIKELRAPFFTAVLIPVTLGATVAWFSFRVFDPMLFILVALGAVCVNAGTNLANDYFDYKSGCDSADPDFVSPFSGGSGLLPRGALNPKDVYVGALISFMLAASIGVALALTRGLGIIILVAAGFFSGYFYTTQLATRGIGELIVGINCGPLLVIGSYYVQTQTIALTPIVASIPVGILVLGILWINEIPDFHADANAGKRTLVTRIGRKRAADGYAVIMLCTYAAVLVGVLLSLIPVFTLVTFVTIPLALKAIRVARKNYDDPQRLLPANATTVLLHLFIGLLLSIAFVVSGYLQIL